MLSVFAALMMFAAAPTAAPAAPVAKAPSPSLGAAFVAGGFGFPLQSRPALAPLQGLPTGSDAAPQCRSACVKAWAICGDDGNCGDQWRQCVAGCAQAVRLKSTIFIRVY
ncbi:MAG TPA: hypothetical protein VL358_00260 [Caulobacteraceae bacterium]|jgi:hypothetical protein|nr:hypothetical protein [Caulobacteraceae bacterium]